MDDSLTVSKVLDLIASLPQSPPPTTIVKTPLLPAGGSWKIRDDDGSIWFFLNEADLAQLTNTSRLLTPSAWQIVAPISTLGGVPVVGFDGRAREVFQRALERLANAEDAAG